MPLIHDEEFDGYLFDCVTLDEDDLQGEYTRVSADMAYWTRRAAASEEAYLAAKANVKREEASAWLAVRDKLEEEEVQRADEEDRKPKPAAVAVIDRHVVVHAGVHHAQATLARVARAREEARGVIDAIFTKREMLVSLGAHVRKEMERDPLIREDR